MKLDHTVEPAAPRVDVMTDTRLQPGSILPNVQRHLIALDSAAERAAVEAGIAKPFLDLLRLRVSQLNGCSYCVDSHSRDARDGGEGERRVLLIAAWRHTELYTEPERAALALAEALTGLPAVRDVPDDVYLQATGAFTEQQYAALVWVITTINAWNCWAWSATWSSTNSPSSPSSPHPELSALRDVLALRSADNFGCGRSIQADVRFALRIHAAGRCARTAADGAAAVGLPQAVAHRQLAPVVGVHVLL
jgi:AhpD family alkylhydroperoxidase